MSNANKKQKSGVSYANVVRGICPVQPNTEVSSANEVMGTHPTEGLSIVDDSDSDDC